VDPRADQDVMDKIKVSCSYQELNPSSSVIQLVAQSLYRLISVVAGFKRNKWG
jgi:hypothetical protein